MNVAQGDVGVDLDQQGASGGARPGWVPIVDVRPDQSRQAARQWLQQEQFLCKKLANAMSGERCHAARVCGATLHAFAVPRCTPLGDVGCVLSHGDSKLGHVRLQRLVT